MMVTDSLYLMMLFVQHKLAEGIEPDADGYYHIRRKEFIDELPMSASTFNYNIKNFTTHVMTHWDLYTWFGLEGLAGETLYIDVSYSNGALHFRRNPITEREDLKYVWARKPNGWHLRRFSYETVPVPEWVKLPVSKD